MPLQDPRTPSLSATVVLTGLRPSPTRHDVCNCRFKGKLAQGPAVSVADRHHSLRRGIMTMTRSAYVQVRCAVVALWSERHQRYAAKTGPETSNLTQNYGFAGSSFLAQCDRPTDRADCERRVPDSNRRRRLCRPLPRLSANPPSLSFLRRLLDGPHGSRPVFGLTTGRLIVRPRFRLRSARCPGIRGLRFTDETRHIRASASWFRQRVWWGATTVEIDTPLGIAVWRTGGTPSSAARLAYRSRGLERRVPDSNRCRRLCRPLPRLSANPPSLSCLRRLLDGPHGSRPLFGLTTGRLIVRPRFRQRSARRPGIRGLRSVDETRHIRASRPGSGSGCGAGRLQSR